MQLLLSVLLAGAAAVSADDAPPAGGAPVESPQAQENDFLNEAVISQMGAGAAQVISNDAAKNQMPENVVPAPEPQQWQRVKAYLDGTSNQTPPLQPSKIREMIDPLSRKEADFGLRINRDLNVWKEHVAPKFLITFDNMAAVSDALEEIAAGAVHALSILGGTTSQDSKQMVLALANLVEKYNDVSNMAKGRHGNAWVSIMQDVRIAETRTAKDARKEYTLFTGEEESALEKIQATDEHIDEMKEQVNRRLGDVVEHWREAYHEIGIESHSHWQDRVGNAIQGLRDEAESAKHEIGVLNRELEKMYATLKQDDREAIKHAEKIMDKNGRELTKMTDKMEKAANKDLKAAASGAFRTLANSEKEAQRNTKEVQKEGRALEWDLVQNTLDFGAEETKVHRELLKANSKGKSEQKRTKVSLGSLYDEHEHFKDTNAKERDAMMQQVQREIDQTMNAMHGEKQTMKREQGAIIEDGNRAITKQGNYADGRISKQEMALKNDWDKQYNQQIELNQLHLGKLKRSDKAVATETLKKRELENQFNLQFRNSRNNLGMLKKASEKAQREDQKGLDATLKAVTNALPEDLKRADGGYNEAVVKTQRDARRGQVNTEQYAQRTLAAMKLGATKYEHKLQDEPVPDRSKGDKIYELTEELGRYVETAVDRSEPSFDGVVKAGQSVNIEVNGLYVIYARALQELNDMLRLATSDADKAAIAKARLEVVNEDRQLKMDVEEGKVVSDRANSALSTHAADIQRILQRIRLENAGTMDQVDKLGREVKAASDMGKMQVKRTSGQVTQANQELITKLGSLQDFLAHVIQMAREGRGHEMDNIFDAFRADAKSVFYFGRKDMEHAAEPDLSSVSDKLDAAVEQARESLKSQEQGLSQVSASFNSVRGAVSTVETQAAKAMTDQMEQLYRDGEMSAENLATMKTALAQQQERLRSKYKTAAASAESGTDQAFGRLATAVGGKIGELTMRFHENEEDASKRLPALTHSMEGSMGRMVQEMNGVKQLAKDYEQSEGKKAAYYQQVAAGDYEALPNAEAEEKKLLQGTERGLNAATEGDLGEAGKMGAVMGALASAGKAAMSGDSDTWNAELQRIHGALNSGEQSVERQAKNDESFGPLSRAQAQNAEETLRKALEKAGMDVNKTMEVIGQRLEFLQKMLPDEFAKQGEGLESAQQPYRAKLNDEVDEVSASLDGMIKANAQAEKQERDSEAKQAAFEEKLRRGRQLEVSHDDADVKDAIADFKMVDFRMDDFDRWMNRYQSTDTRINKQLYDKLRSLGVEVSGDVFKAQQALGMEKVALANRKADMHSEFVHNLMATRAEEREMLAQLQRGNEHVMSQIAGDQRLSEARKRQLLAQIQFDAQQLAKQIVGQHMHLSQANAKIKMHLERFNEAYETAKKAADMLSVNTPEANAAKKLVKQVAQKTERLENVGLFGQGYDHVFSFLQSSLGQGAQEGAQEERHLRSLQDEDAHLAEANAELDADLTSLENRLGSELEA